MSDTQTALEKMRYFIESYPDFNVFSQFDIDYTDKIPNSGGLFPSGLVEVQRHYDMLGNVWVDNQLNFALYTRVEKYEDGTDDAEWQMAFQEWVQQQSATGAAPTFGDEPRAERITAQNGMLYSADEEGTALYVIQINVTFVKNY